MARERSPNRDKAYELFKKANGNIMNREIADQLEISEKTVGGWKSKDKWNQKLNGVLQSNERSTPLKSSDKRGAPPGNQNAKGNKGGAAKKRNKNAVKTGEYETIFADYLTAEERVVFAQQLEPSLVLAEEIQLLRVRQVRMMNRLKQAENGLNENEKTTLYELRGRKSLIEAKGMKMPVTLDNVLTETEVQERTTRKIDDALRIEDALTRISGQLNRALKQFDELSRSDSRKEMLDQQIEKIKAEIEILRGSKEGNADATDWKTALEEAEKELIEMGELNGD